MPDEFRKRKAGKHRAFDRKRRKERPLAEMQAGFAGEAQKMVCARMLDARAGI
jgi:hypothetical protein